MGKRLGIIQSNYIPWKGYFDFIASVDDFVLFDQVQYTRRDWRNRNKIKTKDGRAWLTIPVEAKGRYLQAIDETNVSSPLWIDEHLATMRHAYARATHFSDTWSWIEPIYRSLSHTTSLSRINACFIEAICARLGIGTRIHNGRDFADIEGRNERLAAICRDLGATEYLSGPAAREYMDEAVFTQYGIQVQYMSYEGYPEYAQLHPPFEHGVTILDVFFNVGDAAREFAILDRAGTGVLLPDGKTRPAT